MILALIINVIESAWATRLKTFINREILTKSIVAMH